MNFYINNLKTRKNNWDLILKLITRSVCVCGGGGGGNDFEHILIKEVTAKCTYSYWHKGGGGGGGGPTWSKNLTRYFWSAPLCILSTRSVFNRSTIQTVFNY
jgi:hypothetical protein